MAGQTWAGRLTGHCPSPARLGGAASSGGPAASWWHLPWPTLSMKINGKRLPPMVLPIQSVWLRRKRDLHAQPTTRERLRLRPRRDGGLAAAA